MKRITIFRQNLSDTNDRSACKRWLPAMPAFSLMALVLSLLAVSGFAALLLAAEHDTGVSGGGISSLSVTNPRDGGIRDRLAVIGGVVLMKILGYNRSVSVMLLGLLPVMWATGIENLAWRSGAI